MGTPCLQFWASHYKKNTEGLEHLEQLWKRASKLVEDQEHKSYEEQLGELGCLPWRKGGSGQTSSLSCQPTPVIKLYLQCYVLVPCLTVFQQTMCTDLEILKYNLLEVFS